MVSSGCSVNGTPIWVLEISDRLGEREPEPSVKFVANIHGDESSGRCVMRTRCTPWEWLTAIPGLPHHHFGNTPGVWGPAVRHRSAECNHQGGSVSNSVYWESPARGTPGVAQPSWPPGKQQWATAGCSSSNVYLPTPGAPRYTPHGVILGQALGGVGTRRRTAQPRLWPSTSEDALAAVLSCGV